MVKTTLEYTLWALVALFLGIGYMFLLLGSAPEETTVISFMMSKIYYIGLFQVGGIIGAILAAVFIGFDVLYLKKKYAPSKPKIKVRAFSLLVILGALAVIHYLLEKTFDVI
ncbi:MAG: hypothetical protein JJ879_11455 [Sneathiella sp.]|nr:hypothetical protein [Sneathiella sp.]